MPTMVSEWFLLIIASFPENHVTFREEHRFFCQKYGGCTIFSEKPYDGEQKLFMRIDLHNNAHNGIGTVSDIYIVFYHKIAFHDIRGG